MQPLHESAQEPESQKGFVSKRSRRVLVPVALLILGLTTVAAYSRAFVNPFVAFDDGLYVTDNAYVLQGLTWQNIRWAFTTSMAANWHPLTWLSHMLDVTLFSTNPHGHHTTSIILHVANTLLVFAFLQYATGKKWRALFVAAIFALHPLHVESVAWVAERKDVLSGFFGLLTLIAYAWYAKAPSISRYVLAAALFALGLMSKPMLVTLPCVMLLLDYWPLSRFSSDGPPPVARAMRLVAEKVPILLLSVLSSVITMAVQNKGGAIYSLQDVPLRVRLENVPVAYVTYLAKALCPVRLSAFYPLSPHGLPLPQVAGAVLFLAILTIAVLWHAKQLPYCVTGWCWFLGTLAPVIGILQFGDQALADRYMYLPLLGLLIPLAWGVPQALSRYPRLPWALALAASAACVPLTVLQTSYWSSTMALWERSARVTPLNKLAHYNLGCGYLDQRNYGLAAEHFRDALKADPNDFESITNLAVSLTAQGRYDESIPLYRSALALNPAHINAQINLGVALCAKGQYAEAEQWLNTALAAEPNNADILYNLGHTLLKEQRYADAEKRLLETLRLRPDYVEAGYCLGVAVMHQGRIDQAADLFSKVLTLNPQHTGARRELDHLRDAQ